ncbi:hypothetical protein C8R42DRAFT_643876 [Lentinula raphanica]|nr:hypothetical protein C8R42DRAFT_643876 [Lentinula raphanica]
MPSNDNVDIFEKFRSLAIPPVLEFHDFSDAIHVRAPLPDSPAWHNEIFEHIITLYNADAFEAELKACDLTSSYSLLVHTILFANEMLQTERRKLMGRIEDLEQQQTRSTTETVEDSEQAKSTMETLIQTTPIEDEAASLRIAFLKETSTQTTPIKDEAASLRIATLEAEQQSLADCNTLLIKDKDSLEGRHTVAQDELARLKKQIQKNKPSDLEAKLAEERKTVQHKNKEIVNLGVDAKRHADDNKLLRAQLTQLQAEKDGLANKSQTLEAEKEAHETEQKTLVAEKTTLQNHWNELKTKQAALVSEKEMLEVKKNAILVARATLETDRAHLVAEAEVLQATKGAFDVTKSILKSQKDTLVANNSELHARIQSLSDELDKAKSIIQDGTEADQTENQLNADLVKELKSNLAASEDLRNKTKGYKTRWKGHKDDEGPT